MQLIYTFLYKSCYYFSQNLKTQLFKADLKNILLIDLIIKIE